MAITAKKVFGALNKKIDTVDKKLDDAIVGIYTPGGSYAFDELPALSADTLGKVYIVTDDFTTTSDFVEGAGVDYPAGTNVTVVNRGTDADPVYMYDASTGAVLVDPVPTQDSTNAVSSGGTYDAIEPKADKVTNATSGHLAGLDSNGNLTDSGVSPTEDVTVEGNPVTFESPFEQDAKSVVVSVKPIQDLHGYDKPWAGGANVNKMPAGEAKTVNESGVTITSDGHGRYTAKGTATADITCEFACEETFTIPDGQTHTLGFMNNEASNNVSFGFYNGSTRIDAWQFSPINRTSHYSAMSGIPCTKYVITIASGTVVDLEFSPMICVGDFSAFPNTFSWYSNICPISGIDEVEIGVSGKNLFESGDTETVSGITYTRNSDGSFTLSGTRSDSSAKNLGYAKVKSHFGVVNVSALGTSQGVQLNLIYVYDKNGEAIAHFDSFGNIDLRNYPTVDKLSIHVKGTYNGAVASGTLYPMVVIGEETIPFEPYSDFIENTIPLPSTLYGGDVDVTEGSGNSRKGFVVFDGSNDEGWTIVDSNHRARTSIVSALIKQITDPYVIADITSSAFGATDAVNTWAGNIGISVSDGNILIADGTKAMDLASWKAYLAEHPLQVCYELATPTTLSLTPTDVELLEGTNVLTTNGEKVAVTYGRSLWQDIDDLKTDTEGKLDKSDVADVEGDTASRPYAVNEFMLRSDGFYKVTQPIASGASITGSNTTKTTIGAVLTALLNA